MKVSEIYRHLTERRKLGEKIAKEPDKFKVCDQCESIMFKPARVCTVCHAYRWDESHQRIISAARRVGDNPFPTTIGTAPRLEGQETGQPFAVFVFG